MKLELETVGDDEDLNATMARMSRALKEKMEEIKKEPTGKRNSFTGEQTKSKNSVQIDACLYIKVLDWILIFFFLNQNRTYIVILGAQRNCLN